MGEMSFMLKQRGGQYYHLAEREGRHLSLTKSALGDFVFEVMRRGGEVIQLYSFNHFYPRSSVFAVVAMRPCDKAEFEAASKFKLVEPPQIQVC